jgi:hypothetical protein
MANNNVAFAVRLSAASVRCTSRRKATPTLTRDLAADWRRWTMVERLGAIVVAAVSIALPLGVVLTSLIR